MDLLITFLARLDKNINQFENLERVTDKGRAQRPAERLNLKYRTAVKKGERSKTFLIRQGIRTNHVRIRQGKGQGKGHRQRKSLRNDLISSVIIFEFSIISLQLLT